MFCPAIFWQWIQLTFLYSNSIIQPPNYPQRNFSTNCSFYGQLVKNTHKTARKYSVKISFLRSQFDLNCWFYRLGTFAPSLSGPLLSFYVPKQSNFFNLTDAKTPISRLFRGHKAVDNAKRYGLATSPENREGEGDRGRRTEGKVSVKAIRETNRAA